MTIEEVKLILGERFVCWVCPHCSMIQFLEAWGPQTCRYEKCGKDYEAAFSEAWFMKQILDKLTSIKSVKPEPNGRWEWQSPLLQKVNAGWIVVDQPPKYVLDK